jgi:hypothetical protein
MSTQNLPAPVSDDWVPLLEVFSALIPYLVDPDEVVHDIRRALLTGAVHSLRRQTLDGGVSDDVLPRTFWRDIKLIAGRDPAKTGRDTIGLRPPKLDAAVIASIPRRDAIALRNAAEAPLYGIFYLHRAGCVETWPHLAPLLTPVRAAARLSKAKASVIRDEIRNVYDECQKNGTKPPNIKELAEPVEVRLRARGYMATAKRTMEIGKEKEFAERRGQQGKRWRGNKS